MKKAICIFMTFFLFFSTCVSAFAVTLEPNNSEVCIYFDSAEGVYYRGFGKNVFSIKQYQDFSEIYSSLDESTFYKKIDDESFCPVNKISLQLDDASIEEKLRSYNIREEVVRDILSTIQRKQLDNSPLQGSVVFFVNGYSDNQFSERFSQRSVTYYSDEICYLNQSTAYQTIAQNSKVTSSFLSNLTSIAFSAVNNPYVNILSTGNSILQYFVGLHGLNPICGQAGDYVQVKINSDVYYKYTYVNDLIQAITQKVIIKRIQTHSSLLVYLHGTTYESKEANTDFSTSVTLKTRYYDSPNAQAYAFYLSGEGPYTETVKAKVQISPVYKTWVFY